MRGQVSLKNFKQYPQVKSEYSIKVRGASACPLIRTSIFVESPAVASEDHKRMLPRHN
jgi:hypothetical protein